MGNPRITRRTLLKLGLRSGIGAWGLAGGSLAWAREAEPEWVEVSQVPLILPRLAPEFDGFRLVQLSDFHFDGNYMTRRRLDRVVRLVNGQQPDIVAITGDFVTFDPARFRDDLAAGLSALTPRHATVAVLGNHDHWTDAAIVRSMIKDAGVIELSNRVHTLRRGDASLHFAGLDDAWVLKAQMGVVLQRLPKSGAAILLAHEPDYADGYAATGRFDLQLSGHSHGGQVRLPLLGPPRLPRYGTKYCSGRYQIGDMTLYTNRGIGMLAPYVRFNCRPEITVFTLNSSKD